MSEIIYNEPNDYDDDGDGKTDIAVRRETNRKGKKVKRRKGKKLF